MLGRPYRVVCQSISESALRYLSEWYPSLTEAVAARTRHEAEGWQSVRLVPPGEVPGASITGRQVVAVGEVRPLPHHNSC